jgi:alpha-galactosidase
MAKIHSSLLLIIAMVCLTAAATQSSPRAMVENHADQAESAMHWAADCGRNTSQIIATQLRRPLDAQTFPGNDDWSRAGPIVFCANWEGEEADPQRKTEVRMLWSSQFLYLRFEAHYRDIYIYPEANQRQEKLWLRDVAEVFLQPDTNEVKHYKEFEISPNGDWLDLNISPAGGSNLMCDVKTKAIISSEKHVWQAELAIPMKCLTQNFGRDVDWRLNLFRIEGNGPDRFYSAWRPTKTERPNFHVPEVFGTLKFSRD